MRRREFISGLGGAAAAWPLTARAQQDGRVRRIGVLMGGADSERDSQSNLAALRDGLGKLGWTEGRNLRIDLRFGVGDANRLSTNAAELVKLGPEVIFTSSAAATRAVQQATRTIPIVFAGSGGAGNGVKNIARPEGNTTGFPILYDSIGGKWVELLKEAAPLLTRVATVFDPETSTSGPGGSYTVAIEEAAPILGIKARSGLPFATMLNSSVRSVPLRLNRPAA